jgi:hypothetical protein
MSNLELGLSPETNIQVVQTQLIMLCKRRFSFVTHQEQKR